MTDVSPSRILILGLNPGGDPNNWGEQSLASQSFYEIGEHEYVDCDYPIAVAMRAFLPQVLRLPNVAAIRAVPKTNLIFRRSRDLESLSVPVVKALDEARPFVEEIIRRVQPQVVICEGIDTLGKFEAWYCVGTSPDIGGPAITTPNGRSNARIFRASRARVGCIDRDAVLIGIGHPRSTLLVSSGLL